MEIISSLPDCLLHHILSFLPTKESVRTSVLSKRWIHVWKSVSCLDIKASDFNQVQTFEAFVNLFFQHKQLDTFKLTWHDCNDESHNTIHKWLSNLVSLKPKVVSIVLSNLAEIDMSLISYLFNLTTLESLHLWPYLAVDCACIDVINLPYLKSLYLGWLVFTHEFIHRIILGCPMLEELVFDKCVLDVTQKITSYTLKKFVVFGCGFTKKSVLRICMPNLVYLSCDVLLGGALFENLESLEFAHVKLLDMHRKYNGRGRGFSLRGLSNAKTLQLSGFCARIMLNKETVSLPAFEKLESLDLGWFTVKDMEPIISILKRTPNLKKLTLRYLLMMEQHRVSRWRDFNEIEIQCDKLKTVDILCLCPQNEVHELVKYLLFHLKALESITVMDQEPRDGTDPISDDDDDDENDD